MAQETSRDTLLARMREVVTQALAWLENRRERRFFLFVHAFDGHRYWPARIYPDLPDGGYYGPLRGVRNLDASAGRNQLRSVTAADVAYLEHLLIGLGAGKLRVIQPVVSRDTVVADRGLVKAIIVTEIQGG